MSPMWRVVVVLVVLGRERRRVCLVWDLVYTSVSKGPWKFMECTSPVYTCTGVEYVSHVSAVPCGSPEEVIYLHFGEL